ncbi:hypothetical protein CY0110_17582 [Crocosphaera chwakensis CCY0110]|uniref:Uncharacterized protein n=1 Tax=Crocosphaera chwakensis CCY0110 TaxID=391612 RepID=A3IIJ8_9CHRO|nr:hypothetical protein CY0110_17582 [Crocosphaera chwakensis CCY0110]
MLLMKRYLLLNLQYQAVIKVLLLLSEI